MTYEINFILVTERQKYADNSLPFSCICMGSGINTDRFEEKIARFISPFVSNNPFGASDLASLAFLLAVFSHQKTASFGVSFLVFNRWF